MDSHIDNYKKELEVNGLSKSTIKNYAQRIRRLLEFVEVEKLNKESINQFLLDIKSKLSVSSFNGYRDAIKSFLAFLEKNISIPKHNKLKKRVPEFIDEDCFKNEVIPIVEAVVKNPLKIKTLLYFMFYTGISIGEIDDIKRENIDLDRRTVKIYREKTKKERITFFTDNTKKLMEMYFAIEPETCNAFNITPSAVKQLFLRLKPHFRNFNIHAHLFRHSMATHYRKKGMKIEDIMKLLGHASISSTMIYAHADYSQIKKEYDKFSK